MRTIPKSLKRSAFILALSMSALPNLVNAQAQSLTTVNKDKSSSKQELKDSLGETKAGITQLIGTVLKDGADSYIAAHFAPIIGLHKAMLTKRQEISISQRGSDQNKRACFVVYENIESTTSPHGKRPVCIYISTIKRSGLDKQTHYYRVDLNGRLEKGILSQSKFDKSGSIVRGSGVKTDLDIDSPEVKKAFEAEMKFWLKDWLKNEQKNAAKKTADAATKKPSTTAL
ncbi:MAG: hypothetical protein Q8T11_11235 [Elusimicrobiota bacterium]|nr:hypothetical protein [Elusimicrobiota bacterium]